ncbi:hypothetical protein BH11ARM2_BH11ARM2_36400 [soil metagenome]
MEPLRLTAGPLSMIFEPERGFLRHVSCSGKEIVRGVYAALRDVSWGTAPVRLEELTHETTDKGFLVTWRLRSDDRFVWEGTLSGWSEGSVDYEVKGRALRDFGSRRTGLCLLSPPTMAGQPVVVHHIDDSIESSMFPESVLPDQPFFAVAGLEGALDERTQWRVGFRGEVFETEDQRNWSDNSFKTYCRPQAWPQPFEVKAGDEIVHGVRIFLLPPTGEATCPPEETGGYLWDRMGTVPKIGTMAYPDEPLSNEDAELLERMGLAFIGVEAGEQPQMEKGFALAKRIGVAIRLFIRDGWPLHALAWLQTPEKSLVEAVVLANVGVSDVDDTQIQQIRDAFPGVPIILASPANFTELNRNRPDPEGVDGLGFGANPQVHAFDDRSILENSDTFWRLVMDARQIGGGKPVHVGPVTFGNPHRQPHPDPRLGGPVGAAYTASVVMHAAEAEAASVTLYASHGPRGILQDGLREVVQGLCEIQGRVIEIARTPRPLERQAFRMGDRIVEIDTESGGVSGLRPMPPS